LLLLKNEIGRELKEIPQVGLEEPVPPVPTNLSGTLASGIDRFNLTDFNNEFAGKLKTYLSELNSHYLEIFNEAINKKEEKINKILSIAGGEELLKNTKNNYHNEELSDVVRKVMTEDRIIEYKDHFVQQSDPVFLDPINISGWFDFRTYFYAPRKHFAGKLYNTYGFNIIIIWLMSLLLFITLYYDLLKKLINVRLRR